MVVGQVSFGQDKWIFLVYLSLDKWIFVISQPYAGELKISTFSLCKGSNIFFQDKGIALTANENFHFLHSLTCTKEKL